MTNILLSKYNFNEEWARDTIKKYMDPDYKVAVIPFAFSENWINNSTEWKNAYDRNGGKYYGEVVGPFIDLGISEDNITWLNYFEDTDEKMKGVIESSNIIFLTGGLPDLAVQRVVEKGLDSLMYDKIIMGASAGALMQLKEFFISPDEDYKEFMYCEGLGLINRNFHIEVHYEGTDIQNGCINKALKEKTDIVYAIGENGGILADDNNVLLLGDVTTFTNR